MHVTRVVRKNANQTRSLRSQMRRRAEGIELLTYPPRGFSQVFILKGVKVLCFDTLLQVFILKVVSESRARGFSRRFNC